MKTTTRIKEYQDGDLREREDFVVIEKTMEMVLNEKTRVSLAISPGDLTAFTYGFLYTSGLISVPGDVQNVQVEEDRILVTLKMEKNFDHILALGSSGGRYLEAPALEKANENLAGSLPAVVPGPRQLFTLFAEFAGKSIVFAETGGVHSAAVSDGRAILFFAEDIGRHNAVDKAIGKALLAGIVGSDFASHWLLLSGRISSEIVKKSLTAGIRTIISRAAPTHLAINRAQTAHMTLIGFLRGNRYNIYTNM